MYRIVDENNRFFYKIDKGIPLFSKEDCYFFKTYSRVQKKAIDLILNNPSLNLKIEILEIEIRYWEEMELNKFKRDVNSRYGMENDVTERYLSKHGMTSPYREDSLMFISPETLFKTISKILGKNVSYISSGEYPVTIDGKEQRTLQMFKLVFSHSSYISF